METKTISVNLLNAILQYLNTQPYGQVNQLIQAIVSEANGESPQPTEDPDA